MRHRSFSNFSRRSFIGGAAALGATTALTAPLFAQQPATPQILRGNAAGGNTGIALNSIDVSEPVVSMETLFFMEEAIRRYEAISGAGGWPEASNEWLGMGPGRQHDSVRELKRYLVATGDLPEDAHISNRVDDATDIAIRAFQIRHGLVVSGKIDEETIFAMSVPVHQRLAQLNINYARLGGLAPQMPTTSLVVNIPAALIEVTQGGSVYNRHIAVVGRIDRQTPLLSSRVHQINFNPYWTVPKSIIRRDLITYMNDDPEYLTNYNIRIFNGSGTELQPTDIDWSTEEAVQYTFRQDPGAENSMGNVKINFHNPHAVYLHDTPTQSLFGQNSRFHSSGCVRVENVDALVAFILQTNEGWDPTAIEAVFNSGERLDVAVNDPVPIFMTYVSAWANSKGTVSFRNDIYEWDAQGVLDVSA